MVTRSSRDWAERGKLLQPIGLQSDTYGMKRTPIGACGHPVLLLVLVPAAVALAALVALGLGARGASVAVAALLAPLSLSTAAAVLILLKLIRVRSRPGSISPAVEGADPALDDPYPPEPAPGDALPPAPVDLVRRVIDLREREADLMRALSSLPAPRYEELVVLVDQLRWARLEHAEAVLDLGGDVEPGLRDELLLRGRLPRSRIELTSDDLGKGLPPAP